MISYNSEVVSCSLPVVIFKVAIYYVLDIIYIMLHRSFFLGSGGVV